MPEQVYSPEYDVWYFPNTDDGSGSGATPQYNVNGLIDSLNNESKKDQIDWKYVWSLSQDELKKILHTKAGTPEREVYDNRLYGRETPSSSSQEYDPTNIDNWKRVLDEFYTRYMNDSRTNALAAQNFEREQAKFLRDWQEDLFKNYYTYMREGMEKAGINPLLMIQALGSPSQPSGAMASGFMSGLSNPGYGSLLSSYSAKAGQDKTLGSNILKILVSLLGVLSG